MAVDKRAARLGALALVSVVLLGAVGARLWFLQTVKRDALQEQVRISARREQVLIPERGRIYDVAGRILADNRRVLTVTIDRAVIRRKDNRTALFTRLSGILNVPVDTMEARWKDGRYSNFLPLPVAEDVPEDVVVQIQSRSEDFPGVRGEEDWERVYPYAPLASHVIGYMGLILKEQAEEYLDKGYLNNEIIGQFGVEKSMEDVLHGKWGKVVYEVDSANRVVREVSRVEPVPGKDVQLTIDMKIQQYAERVLETELRNSRQTDDIKLMAKNTKIKDPETGELVWKYAGERWYLDADGVQYLPYPAPAGSLVIENYRTGQIVAMASYPTFDNRWFNVGLTGEKFKQLFPVPAKDDPNKADKSILVNRAIQGQYNLGSTFKPFVAYAAMDVGVIEATDIFEDRGSFKLNIDKSVCDTGVRCEYFNALGPFGKPSQYGDVDVESALAVSSDSFFYHIGELMHEKTADHNLLGDELRKFGFGADTGIDLPFEFDGRIPTAALKKDLIARGVLLKGESPNLLLGDNVQLSIGQGLLAASPLQLANAYSTLANGGFLNRPHIILAIYQGGVPDGYPGYADLTRGTLITSYDKPEIIHQIDANPEHVLPIIKGLTRVVTGPGTYFPETYEHQTTGQSLFRGWDWDAIPIVGKTGTAQGFQSKPWFDSSVWGSFNTDPASPYTVVAYLEKAGYGSKAAAPVAKCVFREALSPTGYAALPDVQLSDPLDTASILPAPSNLLPDDSCLPKVSTGVTIRD